MPVKNYNLNKKQNKKKNVKQIKINKKKCPLKKTI